MEPAPSGANQGGSRFADLRARIATGCAAALIAFVFLYMGGLWAAVLIAAIAAVLLWEWRSITLHRGGPCGMESALLVAAGSGAVLVAYMAGPVAAFLFLFALIAAGSLADYRSGRQTALWWGVLGGLYLGTASIAFFWLRDTDPFGFLATVWIVIVVAASDIGGYFAGRVIGGPKLWPKVSPKKTWAGLAGAVVLAFVVGGIFSWATVGTYFKQVCTVSAAASLLAQAGDLAESAVKRHFGVKDSGRILPGHGGVLDRLDGLTAAILVAAIVTLWRGETIFVW